MQGKDILVLREGEEISSRCGLRYRPVKIVTSGKEHSRGAAKEQSLLVSGDLLKVVNHWLVAKVSVRYLESVDDGQVFLVVCRYWQGGRLVTELRNTTKFTGLSVIEHE